MAAFKWNSDKMPKEYPVFNVMGRSLLSEKEANPQTPRTKIDQIADLEEMRQYAKLLQRYLFNQTSDEISRYRSQLENLGNQLKEQKTETEKWKTLFLQATRTYTVTPDFEKDATISRLYKELQDANEKLAKFSTNPGPDIQAITTDSQHFYGQAQRQRRPSSSISQKSSYSDYKVKDVTPKTDDKSKTFAYTYVSPYGQKPPKKQKQLSPQEQKKIVQEQTEEAMLSCYNLTPLVEQVGMDVKTGKIQIEQQFPYYQAANEQQAESEGQDGHPVSEPVRRNRLNQGFSELFTSQNGMNETCFGDTLFMSEQVAHSQEYPNDGEISLIPGQLRRSCINKVEQKQILESEDTGRIVFTQAFPLTVNVAEDQCEELEDQLTHHFGLCRELLFVYPRVYQTMFIGSSFLRKEVCYILRDRGIAFSGLQLCSCVIYGKVQLDKVQQIGRSFNYFGITQIDNGFEITFENERDAQNFYTLGQVEFVKAGVKGLSIARKAKQ